jgi:hypothetical protein
MTAAPQLSQHGIEDKHIRGRVADFLDAKIGANSRLSVVSAYFTIYAYEALSKELDGIESLRFLFGEPRFLQALDPEKMDKKAFKIEDEGLELANRLQQKEVARRCAEWIESKVEIRSIREANLLHGKLYHIDDGRREHALMGSSNFTRRGLGLSATPNNELTMVVDSDRDRDRTDLKQWFDELWSPLRLKPILSHRYISLWSQASDWVQEAKHIVVVGYSFNNADEHFNDILRVHPDRHNDVIAPEAVTNYFLSRMEKVFGTAASQYSHCKVQGLNCRKARKIRLIAARADQVDISRLFAEV